MTAIWSIPILLRVERRIDELTRSEDRRVSHSELLLDVAEVVPIVPVVPIIKRKGEPLLHVALLDAGGRVHADGGLMPHPDRRIDMARHVERVPDARGDLAIAPAAIEGLLRLVVIPIVDPVVMAAGMIGVLL